MDFAKFIYSVDVVFRWDEARLVRVAVSAHGDRCAINTIIMTTSAIDGASLISHVVLVHEIVS